MTALIDSFRALHTRGTFVIPNAWDVGSARVLQACGASAIATTSSGFAASLGRGDQHITRDELLAHVAALTAAVDIPVSVDAEFLYADDLPGLRETVGGLVDAGAAGFSIEDYDPAAGTIIDAERAAERVAAAVQAAAGLVVTARAENPLYGVGDLDDTIRRLQLFRDAGADVLYAPGLVDVGDIATVVDAVDRPVNVLLLPDGPTVPDLAGVGVRRVSVGGGLAWAAYGALATAARELFTSGTASFLSGALDRDLRSRAFSGS
jgi:2-methylisocitrate lyase-like PEP mutase family enzyme